MVRALAFHQCGPGSIPGPGVICGSSLLLVLVLTPRVCSGYSGFPPSTKKTNISKFQFDLDVKYLHMSPWLGRLGDYSLHYDVKFDCAVTCVLHAARISNVETVLCAGTVNYYLSACDEHGTNSLPVSQWLDHRRSLFDSRWELRFLLDLL